ncbi:MULTISPECIES: hypothetical protein [unclassified Rhizobium]|uniref:hypothetical protein n=1 Tax=unclassified Rhizobium TaxID=2613769 RepID=UPI000BC6697A|nr:MULTISPECIES: hypothetical protein [unclassified Rhizobium]MDH7804916.1 hypothetical protein [Rhizobium sp. AN67]MDQ4406536.1 hypothetical protein [Rhizobium sp. AN63]SOD56236.1 hypothetical protein SAMN05216595_2970 [Rhizobium sp. AN6A]
MNYVYIATLIALAAICWTSSKSIPKGNQQSEDYDKSRPSAEKAADFLTNFVFVAVIVTLASLIVNWLGELFTMPKPFSVMLTGLCTISLTVIAVKLLDRTSDLSLLGMIRRKFVGKFLQTAAAFFVTTAGVFTYYVLF